MPTYDYRCNDCGSTYDIFHKVREIEEDIMCPACNSEKHTRLLSAPNVAVAGKKSTGNFSPDVDCDASTGCCGGGTCGLN